MGHSADMSGVMHPQCVSSFRRWYVNEEPMGNRGGAFNR